MNRLLILPVLLLTPLVGNPAVSADYQKGFDAFKRGDYATALREWTPFAEQADAKAQYNHIRPHQALNMRPLVPETLLENGT